MSGSYTVPGSRFYVPDYGAYGPADWAKFSASLNEVDSEIGELSDVQSALNALVTGWAVMENQDILVPNCSYSAADTFVVTGANLTLQFTANKPVRAKLSDNTYKGSTVASSSYAGGNTTVVLNDAILTNPIGGIWLTATRDGLFPYGPGYVVARDYGVPGQTAIEDTLAAIGVLERRMVITPGDWAISSDMAIDANVCNWNESGGKLQVANGVTVTINGQFGAGPYPVFECTGTGKIVLGPGSSDFARPEWWYSGSGSWHTAFKAAGTAFAAANHILLSSRTYNITGLIDFTNVAGVTITGQGPYRSVIQNDGTTDALQFNYGGGATGSIDLFNLAVLGNATSGVGIRFTWCNGGISAYNVRSENHGQQGWLTESGNCVLHLYECRGVNNGQAGTYSGLLLNHIANNLILHGGSFSENTKFGIETGSQVSEGWEIAGIVVEGNLSGGTSITSVFGLKFHGYVENNVGIQALFSSCNVSVLGGWFKDVGDKVSTGGVKFATCQSSSVQHSTFSGLRTNNIIVDSSSRYCEVGPNYYANRVYLLTLDVAPASDWAVGDTITGLTSSVTSIVVEKITSLTYWVKELSGTYTLGEVLTNGTNTADQGAANPTTVVVGNNINASSMTTEHDEAHFSIRGPIVSNKVNGTATEGDGYTVKAPGLSITPDLATSNIFFITALSNDNFSIINPTGSKTGQKYSIIIYNFCGGAMGTISWDTKYRLDSSYTNPANTKIRVLEFVVFDSTAHFQKGGSVSDLTY